MKQQQQVPNITCLIQLSSSHSALELLYIIIPKRNEKRFGIGPDFWYKVQCEPSVDMKRGSCDQEQEDLKLKRIQFGGQNEKTHKS